MHFSSGDKKDNVKKEELLKVDIEQDLPKDKVSCSIVELGPGDLPSGFKAYPNKDKIYYHTYSFKDIKILSEENTPEYIKNLLILQNIETKGFDKTKLTFYDFIYIAFLMKMSIFATSEYSFKYTCKCSSSPKVKNFKLEDIIDFIDLDVPEFPINVEFSEGITKSFMPLTIDNYLFLIKNKISKFSFEGTEFYDSIAELACCANGEYQENYELFNSMRNPDDIALLQIVEDALYHGLNEFKFTCKCGQEHSVEFLGGELLIYPFHGSGVTNKSRITYGKGN